MKAIQPQSIREVIEKAPRSFHHAQSRRVAAGQPGEDFVMAHLALHQKIKNIRRDPRVAFSVLGDKTNEQALRQYLVVHCNA